MQVLLTGATGFLGNNILRALVSAGLDVTATVRHTSDLRPFDGLECDRVHCDLADPASIAPLVANADLVIHSAAMIQLGWSKLEASRIVNVEATKVLAETARRNNIRMLHISTVDALTVGSKDKPSREKDLEPPKSKCTYVRTKREAEQAVLGEVEKGLDAVILNPGFMIGPWDWKPSSGEMMKLIKNGPILFAPAGGCSAVDVRDVADGVVYAIKKGKTGERYVLGGENVTYFDLWTRMAEAMGTRGPKLNLPNWLAATAGGVGNLASKFSKNELALNTAATSMGQMLHWYDSSKAIEELGYKIGPLNDAIKDAWEWFKAFKVF